MKKVIFLVFLSISASTICKAQINWKFSSKQIKPGVYELHMKAEVSDPWHIYAQSSGEGGPASTKISFKKNPVVSLVGTVQEVGDLQNIYDETFKMNVAFYEREVDFVQVVKLKGKVRTAISGNIEFMICNDHECMPKTNQLFTIKL